MKTLLIAFSLFASLPALADNLDITCHTLGDIGECTNVSICQERDTGRCAASPGFGDPRGMTADQYCNMYSSSAQNCQLMEPNHCHWVQATFCVPRNR